MKHVTCIAQLVPSRPASPLHAYGVADLPEGAVLLSKEL